MVKKTKKNKDKPKIEKPKSTSSKLFSCKEKVAKVYSCKVNGAYLNQVVEGVITIHNADN